MPLSAKAIRTQLMLLKPLLSRCSLETSRRGQDRIGELMEAMNRRNIHVRIHSFPLFRSAWILPQDERREGVILYLHGGGYACGDLEYAKGFGSVLADRFGTRVFCPAYRLAPEHKFPAALEDALESYRYLLQKGYAPCQILLAGESAGGGLCYALCRKLLDLGEEVPCGILGISPWSDLTASGPSYEENKDRDPSMSVKLLDFFATCYADDRKDPLVSPLFADLEGMPPSLLFAGSDEIMLSDSQLLHEKLLTSGCKSMLYITPDRWHGYLLYGLQEDQQDFLRIQQFLNKVMGPENKLRWIRLDNAAKIYPAARRKDWSNMFRVSATLVDDIDKEVLRKALDITVRRFPSISARLRWGIFWYYLQQLPAAPDIIEESGCPLLPMGKQEASRCAFRVIVYRNRIALEFFHSLTDGNGGLIFLKTLLAEYLQQNYGVVIPAEEGILGRLEEPSEEEIEDSFQKYSGPISASRRESNAWRIHGSPEKDGFLNLICFQLPTETLRDMARKYNASVTAFLTAVLMKAILNLQQEKIPSPLRRKPVKLLVPVNLRRLFPSRTLRNFSMYIIPEADPRLGEYSIEELCRIVQYRIGLDANAKYMSKMIAANVSSERLLIVRLLPLFLKNWVMKAVFHAVGERKSCMSISNLGAITLPEAMRPYVQRMDFILGVQATAPHNCGIVSYGDTLYVNFIRNIRQADLEAHFFRVLRELGLPVQVESNQNTEKEYGNVLY